MNIDRIVARARAILVTPKTEWPVIAAEPTTVADLYRNYIAILAAIPAVAGFIKGSLLGYSVPLAGHFRVPIGSGLGSMVVQYVLSLALVYVVGLIIEALAPNFGGQKNRLQALKLAGYAYTASWLAGAGLILPAIGVLVAIAGGIYSIYLLYLGIPVLMQAPQEKAGGYTALTVVLAIVLGWILALIVAGITGGPSLPKSVGIGAGGSDIVFDKDSNLGRLQAMAERMDAAGKKMEAAQKSGDATAQGQALGEAMGAMMGADGAVEALAPDLLKPFVPDQLGGLARTSISVERNAAAGMQVSEATARYADDDGIALRLQIKDFGGIGSMVSMLAGFAAIGSEKETEDGYERTYRDGSGRVVHETWSSRDRSGQFAILIGERFMVEVSGSGTDMERIKASMAGLDLAGLEALRNQGVKKG